MNAKRADSVLSLIPVCVPVKLMPWKSGTSFTPTPVPTWMPLTSTVSSSTVKVMWSLRKSLSLCKVNWVPATPSRSSALICSSIPADDPPKSDRSPVLPSLKKTSGALSTMPAIWPRVWLNSLPKSSTVRTASMVSISSFTRRNTCCIVLAAAPLRTMTSSSPKLLP